LPLYSHPLPFSFNDYFWNVLNTEKSKLFNF